MTFSKISDSKWASWAKILIITALAYAIESLVPALGASMLAIVLGMALSAWRPPASTKPAKQISGQLLKIGIVFLGFGLSFAKLQAVGLKQIYSVERLQALHEKAKHNLRTARLLGGTRLVCGDGYLGLPEVAPFNGILVTAAPAEVPLPLLQQLAVGGRMVIPLDEGGQQYLWLIEKTAHGFHETCVHEARFVPLINGT